MLIGEAYNRRARKALHIAGGCFAFAVPYVPYWFGLLSAVAIFALTMYLTPRHAWWLRYISKPADRNHNVITGLRGYATVVLVLVILWPLMTYAGLDAPRFVMFGWLALALGDGLAGLVGPGPRVARTVPWNRHKTWWGFIGCYAGVMAGYAISFGLPFPCAAPWSWESILQTGPAVALVLALLESMDVRAMRRKLQWRLDDNYLVGLGAPAIALLVYLLRG